MESKFSIKSKMQISSGHLLNETTHDATTLIPQPPGFSRGHWGHRVETFYMMSIAASTKLTIIIFVAFLLNIVLVSFTFIGDSGWDKVFSQIKTGNICCTQFRFTMTFSLIS